MKTKDNPLTRRDFLIDAAAFVGTNVLALTYVVKASAEQLNALSIACVDSIRPLIEGSLKDAAASTLLLDLYTTGRTADVMPAFLLKGTSQFDVLVSLSTGATRAVMHEGKLTNAVPFAATEMVLVYSPKSTLASAFADHADDAPAWYTLLKRPGVRFVRASPEHDPSGRAAIFTLLLAGKKYKQPGLARTVLGRIMNPNQIVPEPRLFNSLHDGSKDAALCYRTSALRSNLPFVTLSSDVNLGPSCRIDSTAPHFTLGETTYRAESLVYYAALLSTSTHPQRAKKFVNWLQGSLAQALIVKNNYIIPADVPALSA